MCETCGCSVKQDDVKSVEVHQNLLHANDHEASHNRSHFDAKQVLAINMMSSPGAGKTRLLEATIAALSGEMRIGVIEGDLETENDAKRIRKQGVPAIQITTGSSCHLDAHQVHHALHQLDLDKLDVVFIENVGNLVCPASFDLGQHHNVVLLSVTEGDDKPAKYPVMFRAADLTLITKADLLSVIDDFSVDAARTHIQNLASDAPVLELTAKDAASLQPWFDWLRAQRAERQSRTAAAAE